MTRATLLQLLAHPTALTGADVHALEQLADAFPYCQTAHLLLAKAAHDQGSMLAGQRLRRAATYAADRSRLRQLMELPVPAEVTEAPTDPSPAVELPAALTTVAEPTATASAGQLVIADYQEATALEDKLNQVTDPPAAAGAGTVAEAEVLPAGELPAQAPLIRPPAEVGAARFEFGLTPEDPAEITAYRLPELALPATAADEVLEPATPRLPAFNGLAGVSYAPSQGSRLGYCLVGSGPEEEDLPGTSLPPAGEFFAPDALLLAHLAAHQLLPKPSPLDLINSFLQRAPTPTRRVAPPLTAPAPATQADLSVHSTRTEPDLASESLARILARQGKTDRAITVYERLMVKHPEKMAYFAAQIASLRPSA